jgi:hypothetical protein
LVELVELLELGAVSTQLLADPEPRYPAYRTIDLVDYLEERQCGVCAGPHQRFGAQDPMQATTRREMARTLLETRRRR